MRAREKGDKGPGLDTVCRHCFLASHTKLKQAGEAGPHGRCLAEVGGSGQQRAVAPALSWGTERIPNGLAFSKINVTDVFLKNFKSPSIVWNCRATHLHQQKLVHAHGLGQLRQRQLYQRVPVTLVQKLPEGSI